MAANDSLAHFTPIPGSVNSLETRLVELETQLTRREARVENGVDDGFKQRLELLEQKTSAQALRLAQIEAAISKISHRYNAPNRRQSYSYHPPQLELQAYTGENLAKRLGVDVATLTREQNSHSPKDFESWCRSRDPGSIAWRNLDDGLFHPIK